MSFHSQNAKAYKYDLYKYDLWEASNIVKLMYALKYAEITEMYNLGSNYSQNVKRVLLIRFSDGDRKVANHGMLIFFNSSNIIYITKSPHMN